MFRPAPPVLTPAGSALGMLLSRAVLVLAAAGCSGGSNPVLVEGVVTLDGNPLEGATVMFRPEVGRPSVGKTDSAGKYVLRYTSERDGAVPGKHVVSIAMLDDESGSDESDGRRRRRDPIPARYNSKSQLTTTVAGSRMTLSFDLESK